MNDTGHPKRHVPVNMILATFAKYKVARLAVRTSAQLVMRAKGRGDDRSVRSQNGGGSLSELNDVSVVLFLSYIFSGFLNRSML